MRYVEDAVEIDADDIVPFARDSLGVAADAAAAGDTGIVDQNRNAANLVGDALGDGIAVRTVAHIEREAVGLAAGAFDLLRRFRCRCGVDIERHHARAFAGITQRDGAADAAACTGDDGNVVLKQGHDCFLAMDVAAMRSV